MTHVRAFWSVVTAGLVAPSVAQAAPVLDGAGLGLAWAGPFVGLLLTMAIGQAAFTQFWERRYPALTAAWIAVTVAALVTTAGPATTAHEVAHLLVLDYLPFVVSIMTLYVIAGGIHIRTRLSGRPGENLMLLASGMVAAGVMGTPGASLLFLPVALKSNQWRRHRVHTMVFFVFVVANLGGGLTPLGPPLLMGLVKGVSFAWTVQNMAGPTALTAAIVLAAYTVLDAWVLFPREDAAARAAHRREHDTIVVEGATNAVWLAAVILAVVACGAWTTAAVVPLGVVDVALPDAVRLAAMVALTAVSLRHTAPAVRAANHFTWAPMAEVAILFAGIFVTMLPLVAMLKAGGAGALAPVIGLVTAADGQPVDWAYFVVTGALSSLLDNAPTFLVFFTVAGGDPVALMGPQATTLTAISAGAAFWGGVTYIGNAPNFMVRSIAEQRGVRMPGFFGYGAWSGAVLLPAFGATAVVSFGAPLWMLGGLAALVVAGAVGVVGARRRGAGAL